MKIVLQRVNQATVKVDDQVIGEIGIGYLLFVAVQDTDTEAAIDYLVNKISNLRFFEDESSKINLNIRDVGGSILSVSQFTLYADTKKGNRPSFKRAGKPEF